MTRQGTIFLIGIILVLGWVFLSWLGKGMGL